jgi:16S rRNA (adenine1518-N6/adenine1519-N6)-dimethyltransferase
MTPNAQHPRPNARGRLRALGLRPRKGLSQSFLDDQSIAAAIVRAARLDLTRDDVLEVGPGLGVLTERLVRAARQVVAIEIDPSLADWLRAEFDGASLRIETADILEVDPAAFFEHDFVVVANLPYHVASPAIRRLLEVGPPFARRLVVMLQAEVAERITARPGELSALAVGIQVQANVRLIRRVSKKAFYPSPKVDSAVVLIEPLADTDRRIQRAEQTAFVSLVQAGFKQPRKKLGNSLAEGLSVEKQVVLQLLHQSGIDADRRPQELDVDDWVRLFRAHVQ